LTLDECRIYPIILFSIYQFTFPLRVTKKKKKKKKEKETDGAAYLHTYLEAQSPRHMTSREIARG
jgi:hypothetical protein